MSIRFRKTIKIAPGVKVNLGKRGVSTTVGGKGGRVTIGSSGTHVGASIPGTGIYASQKIGSAPRSRTRAAATRTAQGQPRPQAQYGTVAALVRTLPPQEGGTVGVFASLSGSPKRKALQAIKQAAASPSEASDSAVAAAVATAQESWTVQREAAFYYTQRGNPAAAVAHMAEAANRFPGDKTLYYVVAADAAVDAGNFEYARLALEPYVTRVDPESDIGGLVLTTLANACLRSGDHGRALELIGRLPLRKQNLNDTLLYALCLRACANRAAGKKAQAKKDIDRVYAHRPDFPMLHTAAAEALAD